MPDTRCQIPGSRCQVPDTRYQIPYTRYQIPRTRYQIPDTSSPIPYPISQIPDTRYLIPDPRSQIPGPRYHVESHGQFVRSRLILAVAAGLKLDESRQHSPLALCPCPSRRLCPCLALASYLSLSLPRGCCAPTHSCFFFACTSVHFADVILVPRCCGKAFHATDIILYKWFLVPRCCGKTSHAPVLYKWSVASRNRRWQRERKSHGKHCFIDCLADEKIMGSIVSLPAPQSWVRAALALSNPSTPPAPSKNTKFRVLQERLI